MEEVKILRKLQVCGDLENKKWSASGCLAMPAKEVADRLARRGAMGIDSDEWRDLKTVSTSKKKTWW